IEERQQIKDSSSLEGRLISAQRLLEYISYPLSLYTCGLLLFTVSENNKYGNPFCCRLCNTFAQSFRLSASPSIISSIHWSEIQTPKNKFCIGLPIFLISKNSSQSLCSISKYAANAPLRTPPCDIVSMAVSNSF